MIPTFMRFYSYSLDGVLNMPARSFFALMDAHYKIYASERLARITDIAAVQSDDGSTIVSGLQKQEQGADYIIKQAKVLRSVKEKE